jgi:RNA polymerase sigma factor (sigma-70 family)
MGVNELAIAAKSNKRYMTALWLAVYRLIVKWALGYCQKHDSRYDLDDLVQQAYFGLLKAVDDYTESCGYKFTTYLSYHCRNEFRATLGIRTSKREPVVYSLDASVGANTDTLALANTIADERTADEFDDVVKSVYNEQLRGALECVDNKITPPCYTGNLHGS